MMKKVSILFVFTFLISCTPFNIIHDKFDKSILIKLVKISNDFEQLDGKLVIDEIVFLKEYNAGKVSDTKLFCKFEGENGEIFEGKNIELNLDGVIYKLNLIESRLGNYEKIISFSSTSYTLLGAFTYSDTSRSNVHVIVTESILPKNIQELITKSKSLMIRIYTKNIDGISKNTFETIDFTLKDIKKFINYNYQNK